MNSQTHAPHQKVDDQPDKMGETIVGSSQTVIGFAILGCLVAGGVGILKAMGMEHGSDVLFCLLGSVAAFSTVFYIYLRKS